MDGIKKSQAGRLRELGDSSPHGGAGGGTGRNASYGVIVTGKETTRTEKID